MEVSSVEYAEKVVGQLLDHYEASMDCAEGKKVDLVRENISESLAKTTKVLVEGCTGSEKLITLGACLKNAANIEGAQEKIMQSFFDNEVGFIGLQNFDNLFSKEVDDGDLKYFYNTFSQACIAILGPDLENSFSDNFTFRGKKRGCILAFAEKRGIEDIVLDKIEEIKNNQNQPQNNVIRMAAQ